MASALLVCARNDTNHFFDDDILSRDNKEINDITHAHRQNQQVNDYSDLSLSAQNDWLAYFIPQIYLDLYVLSSSFDIVPVDLEER